MKKLMIAAAIVCAAVMAQASAVNWKVSSKAFGPSSADTSTQAGKGYAQNYLVYLFNADDRTTVENFLKEGKVAEAVALKVKDGRSNALGVASGSITDLDVASYTAFIVAFDTWETSSTAITAAKNYNISADLTQATYSGAQSATTLDFKSTNWGSAGWKQIPGGAAPEPTSGLLLLLGVAGLALRRRHA